MSAASQVILSKFASMFILMISLASTFSIAQADIAREGLTEINACAVNFPSNNHKIYFDQNTALEIDRSSRTSAAKFSAAARLAPADSTSIIREQAAAIIDRLPKYDAASAGNEINSLTERSKDLRARIKASDRSLALRARLENFAIQFETADSYNRTNLEAVNKIAAEIEATIKRIDSDQAVNRYAIDLLDSALGAALAIKEPLDDQRAALDKMASVAQALR
jgi:hypothetical protein